MGFWDDLSAILGSGSGSPNKFLGRLWEGRSPLIGGTGTNAAPYAPKPVRPPSSGRGTFSSIFDEVRRIPERYTQAAGKWMPRQPGINDILSRLEALQDPGRYMMNPEELEAQARAAAAAQYDPLINQLYSQMQSAEGRAGRQKAELGNMFSSLSSSLEADIPRVQETYQNTAQATQKEYDELQNMIQGQYAQSQKEQEDMLKRLNIEAAAPEILPEQQKDRDFFTNLARKEGQTQQAAINTESRGATEYTRQGSQIARSEGVQRQANLMDQLRELLTQYESQIGSHRAAKEQAYLAGLGDLQRQSQQFALNMSDRDASNYVRLIELGRMLRKDEAGEPVGPVKSVSDVSKRALNMGLDSGSAQSIQNIFMDALGSDPLILSGLDPESGVNLTKETLAARILEKGRGAGLNSRQLNALQTMALEYFGRR